MDPKITRQEVKDRAHFWLDNPNITYSQDAFAANQLGNSYRTDCSGYVSMALALGVSPSTVTFGDYLDRIEASELRTGDILGVIGEGTGGDDGHITLFIQWLDEARTTVQTWEHGGGFGSFAHPHAESHQLADWTHTGSNGTKPYLPYRYRHISEEVLPPSKLGVTALRDGDRYHVFVVGSDGAPAQRIFDGSWHPWQALGGAVAGTPAVLYQHQGEDRYDVFATDSHGQVVQKTFLRGRWHDWHATVSGAVKPGVAACRDPAERGICSPGVPTTNSGMRSTPAPGLPGRRSPASSAACPQSPPTTTVSTCSAWTLTANWCRRHCSARPGTAGTGSDPVTGRLHRRRRPVANQTPDPICPRGAGGRLAVDHDSFADTVQSRGSDGRLPLGCCSTPHVASPTVNEADPMADLTRRSLLTLGGAAGLLALTVTPAEAAIGATSGLTRLTAPTGRIGYRSSFAPLVGRTLTAVGGGRRYPLQLSRIGDVDRAATAEHSFNLIFTPPAGSVFVEGIYRLSGAGMLPVSLLLSPVGPAGAVQALINRI